MDAIQAWKELKKGNDVKRGRVVIMTSAFWDGRTFMEFMESLNDGSRLADDWEIERKPMVWEGEGSVFNGMLQVNTPTGDYSMLRPFIGKRTRIRIEEII